jgi:hypothetical protein
MDYERRLAGGIAARFPVDEIAVAHIEHPLVVRLSRWVRLGHVCGSSPSDDRF